MSHENKYMSDEEMNDLFNFELFKECNCCHRHLCKRPKFMYKGWTNEVYKNRKISKNACKCNCRQNMRMLARKYDNSGKWKNINISLTTNNNYVID
jgi:hypothetical protein